MKLQHRIVSKDFLLNLLLVLSMLLPLTLLLARHPFDGLYGQDPYAYYTYATGPLRDSLLQHQPIPSFFWPPGYPLFVAIATFVVGIRPLAGQIVSLIAGMSVPILTMLLAKEVGGVDKNRMIPILAGGLVAFTPQLWQSSVVVMADTTGLAAATMGVWALARYGKQPAGNFKWLGLAVIGVAYAVLSRWAYALTAIPCGVYTLWVLRQTPRRIAFPHLIGATAIAGGILSPVIVPALSVYLSPSPQTASFAGDLEVYHWNPLNAFQREFETGDGFLRYALPNGVYYAAVPAHRYFFTPLLAWLILPGLWAFVRERSSVRCLILGWAVMVYGFHAGAPWQNFRFALAYLPPLAMVAAAGWGELYERVPRLGRWGLGAGVVLGLGWMAFGGWTLTESFIIRKEAELDTVATVQQQLPADAQVITFGLTLTFDHYTPLETYEIFSLAPEALAELVASGKSTYLFLELDSIETQWVGRAPSENYHWLRDEVGLSEIGTVGMRGLTAENEHIFTLFEVAPP